MCQTNRREADRLARIAETTPECCPKCGGKNLMFEAAEWFAHSLDECDLHNTAELVEHQCRDCGISFWL